LIGHDLERHTPAYIRPTVDSACQRKNVNYEVEGIVRRAPREDLVEKQIWGRVPKNISSIEDLQKHSGLHYS
jgi:hypothetical protein